MNTSDLKLTVLRFIEAINSHNPEAIAGLMTDDHTFTDGTGIVVKGKLQMKQAWISYLLMFPDYKITAEDFFEKEDSVVFTGTASGTYSVNNQLLNENSWEIPAAWRARVENNLISEWQVYCDNKPVYEIVERNGKV